MSLEIDGSDGVDEFVIPKEFEIQTPGAFVMIFCFQKAKGLSIKKELQVLLVHRKDYDLWNLPGGGCDEGENPIDAAVREVLEETGLDVGIIPNVPITTYSSPLDENSFLPGERRHDHYTAFIGCVLGGKLKTNEEARSIKWFPVSKLPKNLYRKHEWLINVVTSSVWQTDEMRSAIDFSIKRHKRIPKGI